MKPEDKELLLKDLCARLPYGVEVYNISYKWRARPKGIVGDRLYFNDNPRYDGDCSIEDIKPYLRPMSSMTFEEEREYLTIPLSLDNPYALVDWLNAHHFDFRNLIGRELALEASEEMYKTE